MREKSWVVVLAACAVAAARGASAAPFAQLSSTETQMGGAARVVTFNACDGAKGLSSFGGAVGFSKAGTFFVTAAGQVGGSGSGTVKLWLRLNGKDMENSNAEQSVRDGSTSVLVSQAVIKVKAGDSLTLVFSATTPVLGLVATKPGKEPAVPSMIFSIFEVGTRPFAQLSSLRSQPACATGKQVDLDQTDAAQKIANRNGTLTFSEDGAYYVIAAGQVGGRGPGTLRMWFRLNGKGMDNTDVVQTVAGGTTAVLVTQRVTRFKAGDEMALVCSGLGTDSGLFASEPRGEPAIPSVIVTAFRTGDTFAQLSSVRTQLAGATARPIALEQNDALSGMSQDRGVVKIQETGTYFMIAGGQVGGEGHGSVRLWFRQNGKDIENSNTEQSVIPGSTGVLIDQSVMELEAGDTIQLMQSAQGAGVGMVATPKGSGPAVPSVILSLFKID